MSDYHDLYQELILDHNRRPRNRRTLESPDRKSEGYNPLCGDRITISLNLSDGIISDIVFEGTGCAISTASASLMTESLQGKTLEQAKALFNQFHATVTDNPAESHNSTPLGKLKVFSGVSQYPARVKCATLAWHTLNAALNETTSVVSTE